MNLEKGWFKNPLNMKSKKSSKSSVSEQDTILKKLPTVHNFEKVTLHFGRNEDLNINKVSFKKTWKNKVSTTR